MGTFYEIISHTADLGITLSAPSLPEIYINSAQALFDLIVGVENISPEQEKEIKVEGLDEVDLLIRWLNELIFLFSAQNYVFRDFEILVLNKTVLSVKAKGQILKNLQNVVKREIKAATYHSAFIKYKDGIYTTTIIFDV